MAVLIPWRGGCPHRLAALDHITARYRDLGWQVITGTCQPGPWCKAEAVADALKQTDDPVLVIADADVWAPNIADAVGHLDDHAWVMPHRRVHRLNERATARWINGGDYLEDELDNRSYFGTRGGGIVCIRRDTYLDIPLDPRFKGWGGEDHSWGLALQCLAGPGWFGPSDLVHLWHPPQAEAPDRRGPAAKKLIPDPANHALDHRYRHAKASRARMRALVEEAKEATWKTCGSS